MSSTCSAARVTAGLLCLSLLLGCSRAASLNPRDVADANDTGSTLAAKNEREQSVLRELPSLASGVPHQIAGAAVVADAPYQSASGRTCRAVHISSGRSSDDARLACGDGKVWFFVPGVFGDAASVAAGN